MDLSCPELPLVYAVEKDTQTVELNSFFPFIQVYARLHFEEMNFICS